MRLQFFSFHFFLLLLGVGANAQQNQEKSLYDYFDNAVGIKNLGINNGPIYLNPYRAADGTDKKIYGLREKVSLNIKPSALSAGSYSMSVRKMDGLPRKKQPTSQEFIKSNTSPSSRSLAVLPELRGELRTGVIISKNGTNDLNRKTVALSVPGKSYAFKIAETDRNGKFTFVLDKNPTLSNLTLQVMDENRNDYSIIMNENNGFNLS